MSIFLILILALIFIIGTTTAMIWATHKEVKEAKEAKETEES